jgi:hypothetical protein
MRVWRVRLIEVEVEVEVNEQENAEAPIKRVTGVNEDFLGGRVKEKRTAEDF